MIKALSLFVELPVNALKFPKIIVKRGLETSLVSEGLCSTSLLSQRPHVARIKAILLRASHAVESTPAIALAKRAIDFVETVAKNLAAIEAGADAGVGIVGIAGDAVGSGLLAA